MPRAGRRSIVFVDMAVSLRKSPKALPKLERVSQRRAIVSLLNAVFCLTVPPRSERSVERSFRHTNVTSRTSCLEPDGHLAGRLRTRERKYHQGNSRNHCQVNTLIPGCGAAG